MITLASGAYVFRTASMLDYDADYTVCYAFKRTSGTDTTGFAIAAGNQQDDLDGTYLDSAGMMGVYTRVANVQDGSQGPTALSAGTLYYGALVRSGNNLLSYLGPTPASIALDLTDVLPFAARIPSTQIVFNGWIQGVSHNHFDQLGRVRLRQDALTLAEIKTEMASPVAVKAGVWADCPLPSASDLTDHSNGRDLSSSGTVTDGDLLPGDGQPTTPLFFARIGMRRSFARILGLDGLPICQPLWA